MRIPAGLLMAGVCAGVAAAPDLWTDAGKLTPGEVKTLEKALAARPGDEHARGLLLAYYTRNARRTERLRHCRRKKCSSARHC